MFKDVKRQIKNQTREQLNHVFVPQQPGTIFNDSGSRDVVAAGVLRFNRKLFVLDRLENYIPNKQNFELFGGDYIFSTMNGNTDGSLNDSYLPKFANVEYSTSFIPSKDGTVYVPYELSEGSSATVYIIRNNQEVAGPTHTLSKSSGKISLELVSGEQIKIFVYYYNFNPNDAAYGYIKIFAGLASAVGAWAYIDVTPPSKPVWHSTPLVTQAADVNASTTSVTLQFKAPVVWPEGEEVGFLIDPDLAGHNIYRVSQQLATSGPTERGDDSELPQTIAYSGNLLNKFVHGSTVTSSDTGIFLAQYNDSNVDEYGSSVEVSGSPKYRAWATLGVADETNYVTNSELSGIHGYVPSGWSTIGTGIITSRYSDGRRSYFTEIKCTGLCGISQELSLLNSREYKLNFSVENTKDTISTVYLYVGTGVISSYQISGVARVDRSIQFMTPMVSGVTLKYIVNSGTSYAYGFDLYDIGYARAIECCSSGRNYVVNGGFEDGLSSWQTFNDPEIHWGNSLFGYKTPTLTIAAGSPDGLYQATSFTSGAATLSAYINLYSGTITMRRIGGAITTITGSNGWERFSNYSSSGTGAVSIQGTANAVFSIDGVQLESGKKLTCFDDINQDGTTPRSASFVIYSGVDIDNSQGTIRMWFHPSWKSGDMTANGDIRYLFVRGMASDKWAGYYDHYTDTFNFSTLSGSSTSMIGVPYTVNNRHESIHLVYGWSGNSAEIWVNGVKGTVDTLEYIDQSVYGCSSSILGIGGGSGLGTKCADGTIDSFMIDGKKWSPQEILADYNAISGSVTDTYIVIGTNSRKANLIPNSNFMNRTSLSGIDGWGIINSGNAVIVADYSKPKSSDVSLKITTA